MIRISKVSKLDGIRSWSLEARETCPGSKDKDGNLVPACAGCYAAGGNYRFKNVKAPRIENRGDWKRDEWVDEMVETLGADRYFRWFDSGDMYHIRLAEKILEVMKRTPWVQHWLPTRMHKFPKFEKILREMAALPNVVVRRSSDSITGEYEKGVHGSTILPPGVEIEGVTTCPAYLSDGKCNGCRNCWDKSVDVVGYVAHGRSMLKQIKIAVAA